MWEPDEIYNFIRQYLNWNNFSSKLTKREAIISFVSNNLNDCLIFNSSVLCIRCGSGFQIAAFVECVFYIAAKKHKFKINSLQYKHPWSKVQKNRSCKLHGLNWAVQDGQTNLLLSGKYIWAPSRTITGLPWKPLHLFRRHEVGSLLPSR